MTSTSHYKTEDRFDYFDPSVEVPQTVKRKKYEPVVIEGEVFSTKKAITEKLRSIVDRFDPGQRLDVKSCNFVFSSIEALDPEADTLFAKGIAHIRVEREPEFRTKVLVMHCGKKWGDIILSISRLVNRESCESSRPLSQDVEL